jgi:SPP1 gp7 family putative phage head morphogenesis protein
MPDINQIIEAHRTLLLSRDQRLLNQIGSLYLSVADRIELEIGQLLRRIADARAAGEFVSPAWLQRERRLSSLLRQVQGEMNGFAKTATAAVTGEQRAQVELAAQHTIELLGAQSGLESSFNRLPKRAVNAIVGATSDGSPLRGIFDRLGQHVSARLREELVQGVAMGTGTDRTARRIRDLLNGNGARARTIARTETIRAYRESGFQTAQKNDDVLRGWTWIAALNRSCPACIVMHGTFHKGTERLASHPNCRCAQRWETKTWAELGISGLGETGPAPVEPGAQWFRDQSPEEQRAILGPAGYDAYRSGKLKLENFVGRSRDPKWGPQYFTRSLHDALKGGGSFPGYKPAK